MKNFLEYFESAKSFNIDLDSLPSIVLTSNFASKYFVTIKTSEEFLERQLTEIGYFCESISEKSFLFKDESFRSLLKKIDLLNESEIKSTTGSVASVLSDFLSFVVSNSDDPDSIDAKRETNRIVSAFRTTKQSVLQETSGFEDKCLALMGSIAHLIWNKNQRAYAAHRIIEEANEEEYKYQKTGDRNFSLLIDRPKKWNELIEEESKITYKTLLKVLPMLNELGLNIDCSPFAIGYFKIFEKEINLSAVHFVRKYLNIEMPQYFNRVKPDYGEGIIIPELENQHEQRRINFNKESHGRWLPPGLGESEQVVKYLWERKHVPIERMHLLQNELMQKWRELRIIRNKAAHPDPLSLDEFNNTKATFESLIDSGIFMSILNLKQHYKGVLP